jgi:hypothetical protein
VFGVLDVIDALPDELKARLEADDFFADIPIIVADAGNVLAEVERKMAVESEKAGKRGVAVIVLPPLGDDVAPEIRFGPLKLRPAFQVIEHAELNNDEKGTKKSWRRVARKIHLVVKPLALIGLTTEFVADTPCIEPVDFTSELGPMVKGGQVNFVCFEADAEDVDQVAMPLFSDGAGETPTLVMSCGTAGAEIWYTTDDSYPAPGNVGSTLYAAEVAIPVDGFTVRACAYKAGLIASQVNRATVSYE